MHCRLIHLWRRLKDTGHLCKLDNLFNSVNLARTAYCLPQRVLTHGVIRKGRGVPECVFQPDVTGKKLEAARGTTKVDVLRGDSKSCDLIVASLTDQKPFYMISHSIPEVSWVTHVKKVWSNLPQKSVPS